MNILSESTSFSSHDGRQIVSGSVLVVNFRSLKAREDTKEKTLLLSSSSSDSSFNLDHYKDSNPNDMFHSVAALYSAALPDMELEAIYSTLTKPCRTVVVIATVDTVLNYRKEHGPPKTIKENHPPSHDDQHDKDTDKKEEEEEEETDYDDPYCSLFSDGEDDEEGGVGEEEEIDNNFEIEREVFLASVRERQKIDYSDPSSVGIEDQLVGCATFMKLSSKPGDSSIQILLLAVRNRWRGYGIGQYILTLCKDPGIVGQYDLLLTYADHKAVQFFSKHGFTDDPIVTARHKNQVDYWENSTLMAYVPPYSAPVAGSLKSLKVMEDQIKTWRLLSVASHCEQVCVMERLHHEVLLLHARVSSQQEVIDTLHSELRQSHLSRQALEKEFEHYRVKMKEKMTFLMEIRAKEWLKELETNTSVAINDDLTSIETLTNGKEEHTE